jgi:hypothetical protein
MIQLATVAALTAVAGGVLAIWARDSRAVAAGLLLMLVAASLTSPSTPQVLIVALRVIGGLLAAYLMVMAARTRSISSEGSAIGPLAEIGIAAAIFCVGWYASPVMRPLPGSLSAQAAGIALVAIAVVPLLGRDVFRVAVGAATLVVGTSLLLDAWTGTGPVLQQLLVTVLFVCVAGAAGLLLSPTPARRPAQAVAVGPAESGDFPTDFPTDSPAEEKPAQSADQARTRPSPRTERHHLRGPRR